MAAQGDAMHGVRVLSVVRARSRHIGGYDVGLFAADTSIHLVEPHCSAALGGQEQLRQYEEARGGGPASFDADANVASCSRR
jgi:hypothetical protein